MGVCDWPRVALALVLVALAGGDAHARQPAPSDAEARSSIIYNFVRFSSWSDDRFVTPASPVVLCVRPEHALARHLLAFDGRPAAGRTLRVRQTATFDRSCHAALVGPADANAATLSSLTHAGVLTIGDTPGFISHGAIGMITIGRQIRFEISNRNARHAGVTLSSRLLRLAVAVR